MLKEEQKLRQLQRNDPHQDFSQFKMLIIKEIQKNLILIKYSNNNLQNNAQKGDTC